MFCSRRGAAALAETVASGEDVAEMNRPSVTSSESFALRAQRSEAIRVLLWMMVLIGMLVLTLVRRAVGGLVMTDNQMFFPYAGLLVVGIVCQSVLLPVLRRANRTNVLLPGWVWRGSAIFDLATAAGLLVISAFLSPRGPVPALSSPPLLLLPLVVLMSVLRLRPDFTLYAGLGGAAVHALLALRANLVTDAPKETYPVHFAYGFILMLTAIAGMFVAKEVRKHVKEAAEEASAHERAERQVSGMQHDLAVARDIQRGLLPTTAPILPGFDITGMNRPADQTGGDYYDWQPLPDGRLTVVLADVSGHGIGPALVMAVCRAYARASAPTTPDPAVLVTRLNQLLHGDLPADRFITFVVGVLDQNGRVELISAGHGPTLLYRASTGDVTQFGGDGMPLGVSPTEEYGPTVSLTLDQGDILVLLTDGFFEWSRPGDGEQFGIPRLQDALRASAAGDAATILRSIDESVRRFCDGSPQSDDMTAIVVKRTVSAA
jgi:serine phosphatase RsbU (regulator of sigma subunit)